MINSPPTDEPQQTFFYNDLPVGYFENGVVPTELGTYRYMPFRGLGHFMLSKVLDSGGRPTCSYTRGGKLVYFEVVGRSDNSEFHLSAFTTFEGE